MDNLINDKIDLFIMNAMKAHDETRTRTLRLMKAAFLEARTEKNARALDEAREIQILQKMVKQREDSCQQYKDAGRPELAQSEMDEMNIIREFLPAPVGREDIEKTLESLSIPLEKKNMGLIIKEIKTKLPSADGKLVADVVKEKLV